MKRIVFFLEDTSEKMALTAFFFWMLTKGVKVLCRTRIDDRVCKDAKDTLFITDSRFYYEGLTKEGIVPLVLLRKEADADNFTGASYFVMDIWQTEFDYFEKVYRRINNIPWIIARDKRLTLRETVEEDVDAFIELYKDPETVKFMEPLYDREKEKEYAGEYRKKVYACNGFGIWTIVENATGKIVGRAGLSLREGFEGVETGFMIGKEYRRQGYATDAIKMCLDFAKKEDLGPVFALVMPDNHNSVHTLKKLSFEVEEETVLNGTGYLRLIHRT